MDDKKDFTQLRLRFTDPVQHDYEVIRPIVLFAQSANSRSQETKIPRTTVREKAKQFVIKGMLVWSTSVQRRPVTEKSDSLILLLSTFCT